MRLDIALVGGLGLEGALDHPVGLAEADLGIAMAELVAGGDVGGLLRRWVEIGGDHGLVQQRRARLHRRVDVGDVGQNLVVALVAATAATAWPS